MHKKSYIVPQSAVAMSGVDLLATIGVVSGHATETDPVLVKRQKFVIEDDEEEVAEAAPVRYLYNPWEHDLKEW